MDSCPVSKKERQRGREKSEDRFSGAVLVICHLGLNGSIYREGVMWDEKVLYF